MTLSKSSIVQIPRRFVRHEWGGTETVILETSRRLLALGHDTEIVTSSALSKPGRDSIDGVSISRYSYFYPYWRLSSDARVRLDQVGGSYFSFSLLWALLRITRPDIIHLHTQRRPGAIARYAALKRQIPYVLSVHGGVFDVPRDQDESLVEPAAGAWEWGKALGWWVGSRHVMDDASAIICVGKPEQELMHARYPQKLVEYLPNGVDPVRFAAGDGSGFRAAYGIPVDATVLLTVARIASQKNQLMAVEALVAIRCTNPKAHWVFVGPVSDESYLQKVQAFARAAGVEDYVHFVGGFPADDSRLADAYHAADVFVLPSVHEPFGIVVLEAWAARCPVLASRVGGIPHFVKDGVDGFLFDPSRPDEFVKLFQSLSFDRLIESAGRGLEKVLSHYTWDVITTRLLGIYEDVLSSSSAAASR